MVCTFGVHASLRVGGHGAQVSTYATQRAIQDYFEDGYYQLGVIRAIASAITDRPEGVTYRQACDAVYLQVRGPALIKLGFYPSNKGLAEFMASRDPGDDISALPDEQFKAIQDAHNRIVRLMSGNDPRQIQDALAMRKAGTAAATSDAFAAEPEPEPDGTEEGEGAAAPADGAVPVE